MRLNPIFKFQVSSSSLFIIYKTYLQSNLTDLKVAKTNRGSSVSQVFKILHTSKKEINKVTNFQKKRREMYKQYGST